MSPGDEHDYRGKDQGGRADDPYSTLGGTRQTRTRLPDGDAGHPHARRPVRNSRSLVTITGVVVLLIAAIAFANRGGTSDDNNASPGTKNPGTAGSAPTAASGTKPVQGKNGTIASGFAHDEQGAQSAAANYSVALGSAEMFTAESRRSIIQATHDPAVTPELQNSLDTAYSPAFYKNVGLNDDGTTPTGLTFVSRTVPVGTKVVKMETDAATVEVWCTGLVGLAGQGSTKPVTETWFTISQELKWIAGDWKISSSSQAEGPTPVNGDNRASTADEMAAAVDAYGGFTYAR
ncbi:hypothetical protein ACTFBT_21230 [Streptomyces microflavus]|uniref:DUF8175 domain-containing protein n=1 Tax=Streptomyces microflavus TaxID=1919 RepID=A0A7J0CT97_STRMI|nr:MULTISPECIES: hypothetical protein [Streptomyces]MDX2980958.1 hypothetical protein [Streptomyces sp. NRRL_B-2249]GFN05693.1 hypothetical protein Smic_42490 [Streptomyces microflavus]GGX72556.1 hypothetical protein GCM10010298_41340 [Streptomyces microflavus]